VSAGTTTITSATASFTAAIVGNIIYLAGGSGSLAAGWYQVTSYTNATTIVVDRTVATGTGITMNIGGAFASIAAANSVAVSGNKIFVKAVGTYTQSGTTGPGAAGGTTPTAPRCILQGYGTTRGDSGRPVINAGSSSSNLIYFSQSDWDVINFILDGNGYSSCTGINLNASGCRAYNCLVRNMGAANGGIEIQNSFCVVQDCEVTGLTSATVGGAITNTGVSTGLLYNNYIHDNTCTGVNISGPPTTVIGNIIVNNTGSTSDGIYSSSAITYYQDVIYRNTIYGNGRHGINYNTTNYSSRLILGNILANNGGYGLVMASAAGLRAYPDFDGNCYYNNTSGTRLDCDDGTATTVNPQNAVAPYVNVFDITTTSTPFVAPTAADWRLNQTATGGGLVRGYGVPQTFPGLAGNRSFIDMGAIQHQDPGFSY
jgi:hypothetical protein